MANKPIAQGINDNSSLTRISTEDNNGDLVFQPENIERMRIDSSGNVGIGTSSPSEALTVNGNVDATSFFGDGSQLSNIGAKTSTTAPSNPDNGDLWWDSDAGQLFVYYNDGSGAQWVEASPSNNPFLYDSGTDTYSLLGNLSAHDILPDTNNNRNLGSSSKRWNTVYATVFDGVATSARYADLAENYLSDTAYEPGTVLVFGGAEEVTVTDKKDDKRVAGVVTTNPAHLMNSDLQGNYVIGVALQGRVPCKTIGVVQKGDILVTSAIPGYACVNDNPTVGSVIGKAVSEKPDNGKGIVEAVVGRV